MGKSEITSNHLRFENNGNSNNYIHLFVRHDGINKLEKHIRYNGEIIKADVTPDNKIFFSVHTEVLNETIEIKLTRREKRNIINYAKQYK